LNYTRIKQRILQRKSRAIPLNEIVVHFCVFVALNRAAADRLASTTPCVVPARPSPNAGMLT